MVQLVTTKSVGIDLLSLGVMGLGAAIPAPGYTWDFSSNRFIDTGGVTAASATDDVALVTGTNSADLRQETSSDRPVAISDGIQFDGTEYLVGDASTDMLADMQDLAGAWEIRMVFNVTNPNTSQVLFCFARSDAATNNHEIAYLRIQSGGVLRFLAEDDASAASNVTTTGSDLQADTDYAVTITMDDGAMDIFIYDDSGLIFSKSGTINTGTYAFDRFTLGMLRRTGSSSGSFLVGEIKSLEVLKL